MKEIFQIKTKRRPKISYAQFLLNDNLNIMEQLRSLSFLKDHTEELLKRKLINNKYPDESIYSRNNDIDWAFEIYRMKRSLLNGDSYIPGKNVKPILTMQTNHLFILSMLYGNVLMVKYFIQTGLFDINRSIFGSKYWPSYFLLAITCGEDVYSCFLGEWIDHSISWNCLTPTILIGLSKKSQIKPAYLDYISYFQYRQFLKYRGISIVRSIRNIPVFLIDFMCMTGNGKGIKIILDSKPEASKFSHLSCIVQSSEHMILLISRYEYRKDQNINGNTPLHYSSILNDFSMLMIYSYMGFPVKRNNKGKFPNELGSKKMKELSTLLFSICFSEKTEGDGLPERIMSRKLFIEHINRWTSVLKYKNNREKKYKELFRYLDYNFENKIVGNGRFNIINVFTLQQTPVVVERNITRLKEYLYKERPFIDVLHIYEKYYLK